jgi:hypothetical protein
MKEKMLQLLEETIEVYKKFPRSADIYNGSCLYVPQSGSGSPGCAVGRLLDDEENEIWAEYEGNDYESILSDGVDKPDALRDFPVSFVVDLQILHDTNFHWVGQELTEDGLAFVERIKRKIEAGLYE